MFNIVKNTNKKGVMDFMLNYLLAIAALFLIISFFMIYFFVLGGADSSTVIIKSEEMQSSAKLINLLKTDMTQAGIDKKDILANNYLELIQELYLKKDEESTKEKLSSLLGPILIKMGQTENKNIGWNLKVYEKTTDQIDKINSLSLSARGSFIDENVIETFAGSEQIKFFRETTLIPIKDAEPIIVELYLSCNGCLNKDVWRYI